MYGYESWTIKKAEHRRIDAFWTVVLEKTLDPWPARKLKQSILKEISPEYSSEGLMLKLHYFGHLMQRTDSFEKTLMLGKIEGGRRRGRQRMVGWHHRLDGHEFEEAPEVGDGRRSLVCCSPWGAESDMTERLNWTEYSINISFLSVIAVICNNSLINMNVSSRQRNNMQGTMKIKHFLLTVDNLLWTLYLGTL